MVAAIAGVNVGAPPSNDPGSVPVVPGTIQAEDFDQGAEGSAYHDLTPANEGGAYRDTGVDIEASADTGGGFNIGWAGAGEWLNYTVAVAATGTYDLDFRVASLGNGGTFHIESGGVNLTGPMTIPDTGGWQTWTTVRKSGVQLTAGQQTWRLVMDTDGVNGATGNFNHITVIAASGGTPASWTGTDIGAVGLAGADSLVDGVLTVTAAGEDIYSTADSFRFVHQPLTGNGSVIVRVTSIENTHAAAKAGLMIRDGLAADAANVLLSIMPSGEVEFMKRGSAGADTAWLSGETAPPPYWLRLTRNGSTVTGEVSLDRLTWRQAGSTTITLPTTVRVGVAVSSHDSTQLNSSTFEGLSVLPSPWANADVGAVFQSGSTVSDGSAFTIDSMSGNVWSAADSFHYAHRTLTGDGEIVARVVTIGNTDEFAKAGVMMRESLSEGSKHVILNIRAANGLEFMSRAASGAETVFHAGGNRTTPVWLKLVRTGSTFSGYVSTDGQSWTLVGSTPVAMTSAIHVGLIVAGNNASVVNRSRFDNVSVTGGF